MIQEYRASTVSQHPPHDCHWSPSLTIRTSIHTSIHPSVPGIHPSVLVTSYLAVNYPNSCASTYSVYTLQGSLHTPPPHHSHSEPFTGSFCLFICLVGCRPGRLPVCRSCAIVLERWAASERTRARAPLWSLT